jgi:NADPH2:quinone reductase
MGDTVHGRRCTGSYKFVAGLTSRMKAVRFHEHGGPETLQVDEIDRPEPGHDEVLVEVEAAAVNPVDTYFRDGSLPRPEFPWIPGCDAAGTVAAVGSGVEGYAIGDLVFATGLGNQRQGTCAEYVVVPTDMLAERPDALSAREGAALALVGVTAWQSLVAACSVQPAQTALIHGGSGGVGHVAVQIADVAGASVTATASPAYHDRVRALGATTVLDYDREDLAAAIVEAGRPDGIVDHRFDEYATMDRDVAAQGADLAAIGNEQPSATIEDVIQWRGNGLTIHNVTMFNTPDIGAVLEKLGRLAAREEVAPTVARTYDLSSVDQAHRDVLNDSYLGKLVVDVD